MKIDISKLEYKKLNKENVDNILSLQDKTIEALPSKDLLRKNTREMFEECVNSPNYTIGAFYNNNLIAITILYVPVTDEEDLSKYSKGVDINNKKIANYKLAIVDPEYRGNNLQYLMGMKVLEEAKKNGFNLLFSTISPKNEYSRNNVKKMGFSKNADIKKYGFERELWAKSL